MAEIKINKVGIEIDGKVYEVYKLNFGTQRRLIEVRRSVNKLTKELLAKYETEDKIPEDETLELAEKNFAIIDLLAYQFVNPKEGKIVEKLDEGSLATLMEALR